MRPPSLSFLKTSVRFAAVTFLAVTVLASCQSEEASPLSSSGELAGAGKGICPSGGPTDPGPQELITALFKGGLRNAALQQCRNIQRQFARGKTADAIAKVGDLVEFVLAKEENGQVQDTNGALGISTEQAVGKLIVQLNAIVGLADGTEEIPEGAFGPGGAVETCQPGETCEVVGGDEFSGYVIPNDIQYFLNGQPFNGTVTFFIDPLPSSASPFPGFSVGEGTFPLFRFFGTIPDGITFGDEIIGAVCVLDPDPDIPEAPSEDQLARLRLAHLVNGDLEILERVDDSLLGFIDCTNVNGSFIALGPVQRLAGSFLGPAAWILGVDLLYARPGRLGGAITAFSPFGAVDPEAVDSEGFAAGFEEGLSWEASGLWNRTTGAGIVNQAVPTYTSLAPDDDSGGALPVAPEGEWYAWYGNPLEGNYIGTQVPGDAPNSGGTSTGPNSGSLVSPAFVVPSDLGSPSLNFDTWFEIESVDPPGFDLMTVSVIDVDAETVTELGVLNPAFDPNGASTQPFTSSGFDQAPSFFTASFSLGDFAGRSIQVVLSFGTGDGGFNGFRGWIVDDVRVVDGGAVVEGLTVAGGKKSSLAANRAACGEPVCPSFPTR